VNDIFEINSTKKDGFYVAPPAGESVASACLRIDRILQQWKDHCAGQKIVVVCHGMFFFYVYSFVL
jgi:broad specificity phosphatase PhoE